VTRRADDRQVSLLPPDGAALLHLVRATLRLLGELAVRYEVPLLAPRGEPVVLKSPSDVAGYIGAELAELAQEQLRVILLDTRNQVMGVELVYQGGVNATTVRFADCFREAVARGAPAIILVHNHPSGDPSPSPQDIHMTQEAGKAGALLGVDVLDHIVIGKDSHSSLREGGHYTPGAQAA